MSGYLALPVGWDAPDFPDAACKGADTDLWFSMNHADQRAAKAACGTCPHRVDCAEWAIARPGEWGIWGGLNGNDRAQIRISRAAAAAKPGDIVDRHGRPIPAHVKHGSPSTYANWACRCQACTVAAAEAKRAYLERANDTEDAA